MKRLLIFLLLASLLVADVCWAAEAEPNDTGSELRFEVSKKRRSWTVEGIETRKDEKPRYYDNPGPVRPTHVAEVILHREYPAVRSARAALDRMRASPLAKKLSKAQQQFIQEEFAVWVEDESHRLPNYFATWLYAVTEADAKSMAQAYLDGLNKMADERVADDKRRMTESREMLDEAQRDLPKKEAQLKVCEVQYDAAKQARHQFESDGEAAISAKQTIVEMDKTLDTLEIELVGIREKLKTVEQYRKGAKDGEGLSSQLRLKLDEMFVEQMIELSGLEARRELAELIRAKEQRFLGLSNEREKLRMEVNELGRSIDRSQRRIIHIRNELNNPPTYMQPPRVYQNKVTIHRIKGAYTPEELETFKRVGEQMMREEEGMMDEYQYQMEMEMMMGKEPNQ
jgi:hypothetical protein